MNITILCGHPESFYACDVLAALNARGIRQISVVAAASDSPPKTYRALWTVHGWRLPYVAISWLKKQLVQRARNLWNTRPAVHDTLATKVQAQGGQYVQVPKIHDAACYQALHTMQVDLMILAGAPIVRAPILAIPRLGTLNAHQGALPHFRGMNVIEWAILEDHPPTLSIHFVDAGVDTGAVVATEIIPLQSGDTLDTIRSRASAQQVALLARTVHAALREPLPRRAQHVEDGRQYFAMHPRLRVVAERFLQQRLSHPHPAKV